MMMMIMMIIIIITITNLGQELQCYIKIKLGGKSSKVGNTLTLSGDLVQWRIFFQQH